MNKKDLLNYFSAEARDARRNKRIASFNKLSGTIGHGVRSLYAANNSKITTQNAGPKATELVRDVLSNYVLPVAPKLSYSGIRGGRTAAHSSKLEDGVVTIHANFRTHSNNYVVFDVPVEINDGMMLEPSVIVYDGSPRIIAQSTFDEIVAYNTAKDDMPVRDMYAAPFDTSVAKQLYSNRSKKTRVNSGIFSVQANTENLRRAMRGQAIKTAQFDHDEMPDVTEHAVRMDEPWPDEDIIAALYELKTEGVEGSNAIEQLLMDGACGDNPNEMQVNHLVDMWERIASIKLTEYTDKTTDKNEDVQVSPEYEWRGQRCPVCDELECECETTEKTAAPKGTNPNKPPKPPKSSKPSNLKPPKLPSQKSKPNFKTLCSKCNHSPCVCPNKRKKKSELDGIYREIVAQESPITHEGTEDFMAKVNKEFEQLKDDGIGEIEAKEAMKRKYGESVLTHLSDFHKVAP